MRKLSLLESMALASATGAQRVRFIKTLVDAEIDSYERAAETGSTVSYLVCATTPEAVLGCYLDQVYKSDREGERPFLLRRLLTLYQSADPARFRSIKRRADDMRERQSGTSRSIHLDLSPRPLFASRTYTSLTSTVVNYPAWPGTIMR